MKATPPPGPTILPRTGLKRRSPFGPREVDSVAIPRQRPGCPWRAVLHPSRWRAPRIRWRASASDRRAVVLALVASLPGRAGWQWPTGHAGHRRRGRTLCYPGTDTSTGLSRARASDPELRSESSRARGGHTTFSPQTNSATRWRSICWPARRAKTCIHCICGTDSWASVSRPTSVPKNEPSPRMTGTPI